MKAHAYGEITAIKEPKTFGKKNTKEVRFDIREPQTAGKRESILECIMRYTPGYSAADPTPQLLDAGVGAVVEFDVNVSCHEWTNPQGRTYMFTDILVISPIKVVKGGSSQTFAASQTATVPPPATPAQGQFPIENDIDDMPF